MGWHFLLQGIFLTQVSKLRLLRLLHWQVDSLLLSHWGNPILHEILCLKPFSRNFPGGLVVGVPCFHCREHGFDGSLVRELRFCRLHGAANRTEQNTFPHVVYKVQHDPAPSLQPHSTALPPVWRSCSSIGRAASHLQDVTCALPFPLCLPRSSQFIWAQTTCYFPREACPAPTLRSTSTLRAVSITPLAAYLWPPGRHPQQGLAVPPCCWRDRGLVTLAISYLCCLGTYLAMGSLCGQTIKQNGEVPFCRLGPTS